MRALLRPFLFLLVCGILATYLFLFETERQEENAARSDGKEAPEFFLEQAITTRYDKTGVERYQFTGEYLEHFKSTDRVEVTRPYFIMHSKDGHNWHARADHATILEDNKDVRLKGNVRAWQPERNLELTTQELDLAPEREYAETDKAVTIKSVAGITQGIGMNIDLQAETLQLHADVKGTYAATK